jgi:plastocyanin
MRARLKVRSPSADARPPWVGPATVAAWCGVVALGAALGGCGGAARTPPTGTTQVARAPEAPAGAHSTGSKATIVIRNFAFYPATLVVDPGTVVRVRNEDSVTHTVTSVSPHRGAFSTGDIGPGQSVTFVAPAETGRYPYICLIHQFMHGTVVVR